MVILHITVGFAECMFRQRDLVSQAPLQRWDPELPHAPADAGTFLVVDVSDICCVTGSVPAPSSNSPGIN